MESQQKPEGGCAGSIAFVVIVLMLIVQLISVLREDGVRFDRIEKTLHLRPCVRRPAPRWFPISWDTDCPSK